MTVVDAGDDRVLESLYHRGSASEPTSLVPCVVAPGIPGMGGTMESTVPTELVWALTRRGHMTLRFNFRGVGASARRRHAEDSDQIAMFFDDNATFVWGNREDEALRDLGKVVRHLSETASSRPVHVVGFAYGASIAARLPVDAPVQGLTLVAPHTFNIETDMPSHPCRLILAGDSPTTKMRVATLKGANVHVSLIADADDRFQRGLSTLGEIVAGAIPSPEEGDCLEP